MKPVEDVAIAREDEARGVRLQLEYFEAESLLARARVRHTVLVMGSTNARPQSADYRMARELGRIVGRAALAARGGGGVMTGGGPGVMEAANRGAHEVGAPSIGFNVRLPKEQPMNPYLTPGLAFHFRYFALRKLHFMLRARALVCFPGGFGTFDELFEALTLVQTHRTRPMPVVLVRESFWRRAFDAGFLVAEGMITAADRRLYSLANTAEEAWNAIAGWYARAGEEVFPTSNPKGVIP